LTDGHGFLYAKLRASGCDAFRTKIHNQRPDAGLMEQFNEQCSELHDMQLDVLASAGVLDFAR
jgi:hypothetical protein